jgi:hypothetical protein
VFEREGQKHTQDINILHSAFFSYFFLPHGVLWQTFLCPGTKLLGGSFMGDAGFNILVS